MWNALNLIESLIVLARFHNKLQSLLVQERLNLHTNRRRLITAEAAAEFLSLLCPRTYNITLQLIVSNIID